MSTFQPGDKVSLTATVTRCESTGTVRLNMADGDFFTIGYEHLTLVQRAKPQVGDTIGAKGGLGTSKYKITAIDPDGNWLIKDTSGGNMWGLSVKDHPKYERVTP